ncbi:MAG: hypothetical protein AAF225_10570, partial [Pseudomonadota bacterium]
HKLNISTRFPVGVNVKVGDLKALKKEFRNGDCYSNNQIPIYYSIVQILNAYEQIATGVLADHLDEGVIKDFLGPRMKRAVASKFRPVIEDSRALNDFGERATTFEAIAILMKRWYDIDFDRT